MHFKKNSLNAANLISWAVLMKLKSVRLTQLCRGTIMKTTARSSLASIFKIQDELKSEHFLTDVLFWQILLRNAKLFSSIQGSGKFQEKLGFAMCASSVFCSLKIERYRISRNPCCFSYKAWLGNPKSRSICELTNYPRRWFSLDYSRLIFWRYW